MYKPIRLELPLMLGRSQPWFNKPSRTSSPRLHRITSKNEHKCSPRHQTVCRQANSYPATRFASHVELRPITNQYHIIHAQIPSDCLNKKRRCLLTIDCCLSALLSGQATGLCSSRFVWVPNLSSPFYTTTRHSLHPLTPSDYPENKIFQVF